MTQGRGSDCAQRGPGGLTCEARLCAARVRPRTSLRDPDASGANRCHQLPVTALLRRPGEDAAMPPSGIHHRHDVRMDTTAGKPDRTLWVVIAVVAALVVVALIVVFSRGGSPPLDESTPAGVVQRYTAAVLDGDQEGAKEYLPASVARSCERTDPGTGDDIRATLASTDERDDRATVTVTISQPSGGGIFGPSEYQYDTEFELSREADRWVIDTAPWEFAICVESTP